MARSGIHATRLLVSVALALGCGAFAGCLLDLPVVCGDGQVDLDEDCDPAAEGESPTSCDSDCKKIVLPTCGDGKLDAREQCDGNDFGNKDCPSGKGFLSCTDDCKLDERTCDPCGNGRVDVDYGEECDPKVGPMFLQPKACAELMTYPLKPYTSGQMTACTDKCQWYRGPCGYCGDNEADLPQIVDLNYPAMLSGLEVCDGQDAQIDKLRDFCAGVCGDEELRCNFDCSDSCKELVEPPEDPQCCAQAGAPCPNMGDPLPCCAAYDADLEDLFSQEACTDRFQQGGLKTRVCK